MFNYNIQNNIEHLIRKKYNFINFYRSNIYKYLLKKNKKIDYILKLSLLDKISLFNFFGEKNQTIFNFNTIFKNEIKDREEYHLEILLIISFKVINKNIYKEILKNFSVNNFEHIIKLNKFLPLYSMIENKQDYNNILLNFFTNLNIDNLKKDSNDKVIITDNINYKDFLLTISFLNNPYNSNYDSFDDKKQKLYLYLENCKNITTSYFLEEKKNIESFFYNDYIDSFIKYNSIELLIYKENKDKSKNFIHSHFLFLMNHSFILKTLSLINDLYDIKIFKIKPSVIEYYWNILYIIITDNSFQELSKNMFSVINRDCFINFIKKTSTDINLFKDKDINKIHNFFKVISLDYLFLEKMIEQEKKDMKLISSYSNKTQNRKRI